MQYCHKFTAMTKEFVDHLVDLITNHAINAFFAPITGTPSEKERVLEALGRKLLEILISLTILSKKLMFARFIRTWEVNLDVVIRASESGIQKLYSTSGHRIHICYAICTRTSNVMSRCIDVTSRRIDVTSIHLDVMSLAL